MCEIVSPLLAGFLRLWQVAQRRAIWQVSSLSTDWQLGAVWRVVTRAAYEAARCLWKGEFSRSERRQRWILAYTATSEALQRICSEQSA